MLFAVELVRQDADVFCTSFEARNGSAAQGRKGAPDGLAAGLGIHLSFALNDLAVKASINVRVLRRSMIVVSDASGRMAIEGV